MSVTQGVAVGLGYVGLSALPRNFQKTVNCGIRLIKCRPVRDLLRLYLLFPSCAFGLQGDDSCKLQYSLFHGVQGKYSVVAPRVAGFAPRGAEVTPGGAKVTPGGAEVAPGVAEVTPGGAKVAPGGAEVAPGVAEVTPRGAKVAPGVAKAAKKSYCR